MKEISYIYNLGAENLQKNIILNPSYGWGCGNQKDTEGCSHMFQLCSLD
jgi:hypothetical protein